MLTGRAVLFLVACLSSPFPTSSFSAAPFMTLHSTASTHSMGRKCSAVGLEAVSRRAFLASAASTILLPLVTEAEDAAKPAAETSDAPQVSADKLYSGPTAYGFQFKYPASWKVNKRVGNKHLYDLEVKPKDGGGVIGVTIDQIKIGTITELGPLNDIAEKVRSEQERATKGVEVVLASAEEKAQKKMKYYIISTSTQKAKRFVKMAATAEQLFTFSVTIPSSRTDQLEAAALQALNSFKVEPNSMENFQAYGKNQAPDVLEYFRKLPSDFVKIESGDF